jgi:hypothetical protein
MSFGESLLIPKSAIFTRIEFLATTRTFYDLISPSPLVGLLGENYLRFDIPMCDVQLMQDRKTLY